MILFVSLDPEDGARLNEVIARELKTELMECEAPSGGYDFTLWSDRFPEWVWLQEQEKCQRILPAIALMVRDQYQHELTPLYESVICRSLQAWRDVARDRADDTQIEQERQDAMEYHEELEFFLNEAFEDGDFLNVPMLADAALRGTNLLDELGVSIEDFFDMMPDDIRRDIERRLATKSSSSAGHPTDNAGPRQDSD